MRSMMRTHHVTFLHAIIVHWVYAILEMCKNHLPKWSPNENLEETAQLSVFIWFLWSPFNCQWHNSIRVNILAYMAIRIPCDGYQLGR